MGLVGVAAAQAPVADQYAEATVEISVLSARVLEQEALIVDQIGEISAVSPELDEAQSWVKMALGRANDLVEQARSLEKELASRRETFKAAKAGYEERAKSAYKGSGVDGLSTLLSGQPRGPCGPARSRGLAGRQAEPGGLPGVADKPRQNTSRQISGKRRDYDDACEKSRSRSPGAPQARRETPRVRT